MKTSTISEYEDAKQEMVEIMKEWEAKAAQWQAIDYSLIKGKLVIIKKA